MQQFIITHNTRYFSGAMNFLGELKKAEALSAVPVDDPNRPSCEDLEPL